MYKYGHITRNRLMKFLSKVNYDKGAQPIRQCNDGRPHPTVYPSTQYIHFVFIYRPVIVHPSINKRNANSSIYVVPSFTIADINSESAEWDKKRGKTRRNAV